LTQSRRCQRWLTSGRSGHDSRRHTESPTGNTLYYQAGLRHPLPITIPTRRSRVVFTM
jgi:hypothetical protein